MKKVVLAAAISMLFSGAAHAADASPGSYSKAPPARAPIFSWTGFYVGGHLGGGWSTSTATAITPTASFPAGTQFSSRHLNGALGGVQAGFNYQFDRWVLGVEGEYSRANLKGTSTTPGIGFSETSNYSSPYMATIAGRVGYAADRVLLYAKGGYGWVRYEVNGVGFANATGVVTDTFVRADTQSGWVAGAGLEWAFAGSWTAKAEYLHFDLGTFNTVVTDSVLGTLQRRNTATVDQFKVGINFLFNGAPGAPIAARY